jgi:hypothetical protein
MHQPNPTGMWSSIEFNRYVEHESPSQASLLAVTVPRMIASPIFFIYLRTEKSERWYKSEWNMQKYEDRLARKRKNSVLAGGYKIVTVNKGDPVPIGLTHHTLTHFPKSDSYETSLLPSRRQAQKKKKKNKNSRIGTSEPKGTSRSVKRTCAVTPPLSSNPSFASIEDRTTVSNPPRITGTTRGSVDPISIAEGIDPISIAEGTAVSYGEKSTYVVCKVPAVNDTPTPSTRSLLPVGENGGVSWGGGVTDWVPASWSDDETLEETFLSREESWNSVGTWSRSCSTDPVGENGGVSWGGGVTDWVLASWSDDETLEETFLSREESWNSVGSWPRSCSTDAPPFLRSEEGQIRGWRGV